MCDLPIIAILAVYLMFCQSCIFEPNYHRQNTFALLETMSIAKVFVEKFKELAHAAVPNLDDIRSGHDRSFWHIAHQYLIAINDFDVSILPSY